MPLIHDSVSGATWYDADASKYAGSARYTVSADTAGGTQTGMGYDPQVGQQQWALDYALRSGTAAGQQATNQYGAETGRLNAQTQQYGAQTSRALGAGDLYRQLFGLPDNYAATANLLRGAPNASPAHFWGALQGLAPLGHSPNFGAMKTLDANKAVSGFFGAAGASGGSGGGGSSGGGGGGGSGGDTSDIKWKRDYHQAVRDAGFGTGSAAREAANASIGMGEAAAAHEIKHHRNPYKGGAKFAAGGSLTVPAAGHTARTFVATDPLHFRVGPQPFIVGERSKDELVDIAPAAGGGTRVTVAPLQNPAVPVPAYAASLANDLVPGSPYRPTPLGPLGAQPFIGLPPTPPMGGAQMGYAAYSGPPIPDTRLVIPRLGGAGGSAHGGWSGVYPPESETLPLSPIGTVPLTPMPPSLQDRPRIALAMGGAVGVPPPSAGFGGIRDLPPIRYEGGGGTTVPALPPTLSLADRYSQQWGLDDPNVLRALIMAESTGDPNAVGDNGNSIGLLQANMAGGRGQGYTADQLRDPDFNLSIAQPEITSTYAAGKAQGLAGRDLTRYVAVHAQRAGSPWRRARATRACRRSSRRPLRNPIPSGRCTWRRAGRPRCTALRGSPRPSTATPPRRTPPRRPTRRAR
jgi:hypothetical protein